MMTINDLMDQAKKAQSIQSDYKLAQLLNATQNTVANWRHGRSRPDDKMLARLGELASAEPQQIELLAVQLQADRASTDQARQLWQRLAARLQAGAVHLVALVVVGLVGIVSSPSAHAVVTSPAAADKVSSVYYVKQRLGQLFRALRRAARSTLGLFKEDTNVSSADADPALFNPA